MKVSREAAARTRQRIVETAGVLFRERGFDGVGVADIMKRAGLTHGGFYGHFASKADLAAEACRKESPAAADLGASAATSADLASFVASYLSLRHRNDPGGGCTLAALAADVAREPETVRSAFTDALRVKLERLIRIIPGRSEEARRRKALATLAGLVGALTLARAVADPKLSEELLAAAKESFSG